MPRPWTVLPHTPLEKLQPNLWTVEATTPSGPFLRRMGVARLDDGRLVLLNAIALDENAMKEIEAFGQPAFVIVPNGFHRLDLGSYKARYPSLRILAAPAARKRVSEIAPVDGWLDLLPKDAGVVVEEVRGGKMGDAVAIVRSGAHATVVAPGDILTNMVPAKGGVSAAIARLLGFVGELRVPRLIKWIGVKDKRALREHLLALAETPGLQRVFTCHGPVVSVDPTGALRRAAQAL
jgi:hypothetical protein